MLYTACLVMNNSFCHAMLCISAAYAVMRCLVSVRLSVTFVDSVKRRKTYQQKFSPSDSQTILVFPYQTSWQFFDGDPANGASDAGGVGTNRDRRRYSWLLIDDVLDLRATSATIHRAVYRTYGDASVKLYLSQPAACITTTKRREQNLFVRSGKSEA